MTLIELQDILGNRISVTLKEMAPEERQIENEQSRIINGIAKQMINNGKLILETEKALAQSRNLHKSYAYLLISGKDTPDERITA